MEIITIPVLNDNYIFLLIDRNHKIAAVVDPAVAPPVLNKLQELDVELVAIFNTHHHSDHVGGNRQLLEVFPDACVYAGAEDEGRIPGQRVFLQEDDRVTFADRTAEVFFLPGHTRAHIAYYFPPISPDEPGELFCGDTLFAGGCGRLFEGTPAQMVHSLTKLRKLPEHTRVWCAHEYTLNNLRFAMSVDKENPDLQQRYHQVKAARDRHEPTIPSQIGIEKLTNPFLRWDAPAIQASANSQDPVQTLARIRGMKDRF
jgi:hydroxyacylglutathione hydrolase